MPRETKASFGAVGAGCAINLFGGISGATIGYLLMPAIPDGGYYGAIGEVLGLLFLYCGGGSVIGLIAGAFVAGRIAQWIDRRQSQSRGPNDTGGKDLT